VDPVGIKEHPRSGEAIRAELSARSVLVVEDEALICVETADCFERQGFEVHVAVSAEDAMRLLGEGLRVDILFTDVNLAGRMDGVALARFARALDSALVVVYTSGTVNAVAAGVPGSQFIAKPYSPDRVGRMLARLAMVTA